MLQIIPGFPSPSRWKANEDSLKRDPTQATRLQEKEKEMKKNEEKEKNENEKKRKKT